MTGLDAWLRGPVEGVPELLMPVAHALIQTPEDVERAAGLDVEQTWMRPGGAASVGFHLRHIAGVVDRLFTYARGEELDAEQLEALRAEAGPGDPRPSAEDLLRRLREVIERALAQLRGTPPETLLERREVGRKKIPSNVLGLLFHAAEHAQRHTGQVVATAKIIRGIPSSGAW
ncbi:MAG TPA: DinB family protein [Longimicrobiales bacterium]|nr:DinB family protein [Longimicrobiales bacterium]